jgi:hypothetical protein
MKALVVIPTHNHGRTIEIALDFLSRQTHRDFEAVIIGDGVPEEWRPTIEATTANDMRVRVQFHPKHPRRGEPYRDQVIRESDADIVCYLTDRDIWFEDHLAEMFSLLANADYAHTLGVHVLPDGAFRGYACDLSQPGYKHMLLTTNDNRMPFSTFGHRREAYLKLEEGWSTTPANEWTDLHMIRKFIRQSGLRGASGLAATAVTFPSPPRIEWSPQQRREELSRWAEKLSTPDNVASIRMQILATTLQKQRDDTANLSEVLSTMASQRAPTPVAQATSFASLNSYRK